jgi:hypothetical protein
MKDIAKIPANNKLGIYWTVEIAKGESKLDTIAANFNNVGNDGWDNLYLPR